MNFLSVAFWSKDSGNYLSHTKGLTEEQIAELQKLKPGDRLILYKNDRKKETDSSLSLKVYKPTDKLPF